MVMVNDGKVECLICGKRLKAITIKHLKLHGMTVKDYKKKFGEDTPIMGEATVQAMLDVGRSMFTERHLIRLTKPLEKDVNIEYNKEREKAKKEYGGDISKNVFFNRIIADGIKKRREEEDNAK